MDRNAYPTLERFEIAHRELSRPHNSPVPESIHRVLNGFAMSYAPSLHALEGASRDEELALACARA